MIKWQLANYQTALRQIVSFGRNLLKGTESKIFKKFQNYCHVMYLHTLVWTFSPTEMKTK